jgi:hypothetical protein
LNNLQTEGEKKISNPNIPKRYKVYFRNILRKLGINIERIRYSQVIQSWKGIKLFGRKRILNIEALGIIII